MNKIKILDCTLRDGGYYNNWDFSREVVNDYLRVMSLVRIDYVEVGFRSFKAKNFKGPTWYTTESYLNSLSIPKNLIIGVMVNASELISHSLGIFKSTPEVPFDVRWIIWGLSAVEILFLAQYLLFPYKD